MFAIIILIISINFLSIKQPENATVLGTQNN